jgi:hypothetical protein
LDSNCKDSDSDSNCKHSDSNSNCKHSDSDSNCKDLSPVVGRAEPRWAVVDWRAQAGLAEMDKQVVALRSEKSTKLKIIRLKRRRKRKKIVHTYDFRVSPLRVLRLMVHIVRTALRVSERTK